MKHLLFTALLALPACEPVLEDVLDDTPTRTASYEVSEGVTDAYRQGLCGANSSVRHVWGRVFVDCYEGDV